MPKREFIKAEAQFVDDRGGGTRARVPAVVRDRLGARLGDKIIFEEGCDAAVQRAALRGAYFVIRLERSECAVGEAVAPYPAPAAGAPDLESLADAVARKRRGE